MKHSSGTASNLYQSIHQQLNMCSVAAVVAVVSVLALTQPSEAKIVYTPAKIVINFNEFYNLDLNHDGVADFTIQVTSGFREPCLMEDTVDEIPASGNGAESSPPAALNRGALIGRRQQFYGSQGKMAQVSTDDCGHSWRHGGPWFGVTDRYLGLSFQHNGRTHYGWARLTVQFDLPHLKATLTGYAYETVAGKSIKAGQKKEATDESSDEDFGPGASLTNPIPDTTQHASLGMLALGAQGIPLCRRKESALECAAPLKPAPITGSDGYYGYYSLHDCRDTCDQIGRNRIKRLSAIRGLRASPFRATRTI
jgi:hypothetical protein